VIDEMVRSQKNLNFASLLTIMNSIIWAYMLPV